MAPQARRDASLRIVGLLLEQEPFWPDGPVSAYWPIRSEVDPRAALEALRERGRSVLLPRVGPEGLRFLSHDPGDELVPARFGLREPVPGALEGFPAVMLVPLAGFDRRGHRIGYGAGHYDRAIAGLAARRAHPFTIGLAFGEQEVDRVPDERHDWPLDAICTQNGFLIPAPNGADFRPMDD